MNRRRFFQLTAGTLLSAVATPWTGEALALKAPRAVVNTTTVTELLRKTYSHEALHFVASQDIALWHIMKRPEKTVVGGRSFTLPMEVR